jgi:hypothetical protein
MFAIFEIGLSAYCQPKNNFDMSKTSLNFKLFERRALLTINNNLL